MWSWFGGAAAQKRKDVPKNAILQLREQLDMLQKREKHLEAQVAEQDAAARKHVNTNKNGRAFIFISVVLIIRNAGDFSRTLHGTDFTNLGRITAAKAALRRKKALEKNAEQTSAQILQLEQQVYSIEAANINHETLVAMERAGKAMQQIHNGMNIDKVDKTMYVDLTREKDRLSWEGPAELRLCFPKLEGYGILTSSREDLREQHALSEEIGRAITDVPLGEQPDEDELEQELEGLEQEQMDERMLNTGPTPVTPALDRLPAAGTSDRKSCPVLHLSHEAGRQASLTLQQ